MSPVFDAFAYKQYLHSGEIWRLPVQFARDLRCCVQRIRKGYCYKDLWEIDTWFLSIIPEMIREFKENSNGFNCMIEECTDRDGEYCEEKCRDKWDAMLDRMAFLFREANEMTCTRKNPYEDEYSKCWDEFNEKYGLFGEKLKTREALLEEEKTGCSRAYTLANVPEYAEKVRKYLEEDKTLWRYRDHCKDEAFALFVKYFWTLWD